MKANHSSMVLAVIGGLGFALLAGPLPAGADAGAAPAVSRVQGSTAESVPDGLTSGDWAGIRTAHETWRHRFARGEDGTYSAANTGQQWRAVFDGRGFVTEPKGQTWRWGLELKSYGIGDTRTAVTGAAKIEASETRLSYRWDGRMEEWFVNDRRGLEQGWTLSGRPAGADDQTLRVDLAVRGDLRPVVDADGRSVNFVSGDGVTMLTYGGLKAWDAAGRVLPTRFISSSDGMAVEVDERGAAYPVTIDPIAQQAYLKASNTGVGDEFGVAVAVSGNTVVVGADDEDSSTTGVNSTPNEGASFSGAAYVFTRSAGTWSQQAYLKASNTGADDQFGVSVAVSGDTVVVGARFEDSGTTGVNGTPNEGAGSSGAAYVFTRSAGTWSQQAYLKAGNTGAGDQFGISVAVSGNTVVVGAVLEDSSTTGVNSTPNEGAVNSGAAYVFTHNAGTWSQQAYLKAGNTGASDELGYAVAVSGDTVVVGAYREGSSTTGVNSTPNEGAGSSGAAYVFTRSAGTWSQQAYLKAGNTGAGDIFGLSVAVSGDTVVVGASNEDSSTTGVNSTPDEGASFSGAAYVFTRNAGTWSQQAYLKAGNTGISDQFGTSVAISGNTVVVGAYGEDSSTTGVNSTPDDAAFNSGAAYVFTRSAGTWSQQAYLKAGNTGGGDELGYSVAVSGGTVVVGAYGEDSSSTGVNSTPNEEANTSGAAYLFTIPSNPPTVTVPGRKNITTSKSSYTLKGTAADLDGDLVRVEARDSRPNGAKKFRAAIGATTWEYKARLKPGRNTIKIRAVDAAGNLSPITRVRITRN